MSYIEPSMALIELTGNFSKERHHLLVLHNPFKSPILYHFVAHQFPPYNQNFHLCGKFYHLHHLTLHAKQVYIFEIYLKISLQLVF